MDKAIGTNPSASEKNPKSRAELLKAVYDWLEIFCLSAVLVILLFTFVGRTATVVGDSMERMLHNGDKVLVSSLLYTPECGDIVVVQKESGYYEDELLIKRVIAKGGQTVTIDFEAWTVSVDGEVIDEPYVRRVMGDMHKGDMTVDTVTVPEGCYFVLGDNRNESSDSRYDTVGFVKKTEILGHAFFRISPDFGKLD